MPIYLTHPLHGVHVAYTEDEVRECQKNGWKVREDEPIRVKKMEPTATLRLPRRKDQAQ